MDMRSLASGQKAENQAWIRYFTDKHSFRFFDPTYKETPDVSSLIEDQKVKQVVFELENYLLESYPIDMGTNVHSEMKKLIGSFSKEERRWHKAHNKLGINGCLSKVGIALFMLNRYLDRTDLKVNVPLVGKGYSSMSFDDKLELCTSVDKELYALLERLHSDYAPIQAADYCCAL